MRKLLMLVWFWTIPLAGRAEVPSWNSLQAAVKVEDFERVKGWVSQNGVESSTAANALIAAAMDGNRTMVDRLLALGISVNATNQFGSSPLLKAADVGITEMVHHLLKRGANATAIGRCNDAHCKGHSTLMGAVCKRDLEMAKVLLEAGADPHVAEDAAINTANQNGDVPLFLLLQQFGAREKAVAPADAKAQSVESVISLSALGLSELLPGKVTAENLPAPGTQLRLSIITDENNLVLGDLLSARLSSEPSLQLVERQELDRVLAEQKLTRQFAAEAKNYSRVASLLKANALLLIQTRQVANTKVVESRLIRVNPGVALDTVYSSMPVESPPKWAERMGSHTVSLISKVTRTNAVALSLLNIRAAITGSRNQGLERTIAVMLNDRLAHEPHCVLLERTAMQRMTFESTDPFWTGSYLVDGTIEPALDNSGGFTLSVRFQPTGRGEALGFTTAGQRANPAKAIDELLVKINARLAQATPPQKRDLADEAERYLEEARWAFAANQIAAAQSTAEAAWALGLRSTEVARLRVLTARLMVRELCYQPESIDVAGSIEFGIHALSVWRDVLQSELIQGRPEELRRWLEFGLETIDSATLALIRIPTAAERVRQARRIEALQQLAWESLQEMWRRSGEFSDTAIGNAVSERQAAIVRLFVPRNAELIPAVQSILSRKFSKGDAVTRARIRSNLITYWNLARVMVQTSRTSGQSATWSLPRADETSRQLASQLQNSTAPEDRYVSALLSISTASLRGEATPADVNRLKASLFDMDGILAEGGDVFKAYWECFAALDKLDGVPFFAINRTFNADQSRMWERNTPEHTEFRRQLFLRIAATASVPASHFQKLISSDQYTPEQAAEVSAAQTRMVASAPAQTPRARGGLTARYGPQTIVEAAPVQGNTGNASPLRVSRLWTPFNLGLRIPPEFNADLGMMTCAEGRLWLHGSTLDRGGQADQHFIFAIEPDSLRTVTITLPERSADSNARIAVTPTHLLFVQRNSLAVQDRATGRWDRYDEIHAANYDPLLIVGDSLYLMVAEPPGNALLSFDFKQRTTEILASTRRRPAASPFDDPGLELKSITTNQAGEIIVVADTFAPNVPSIERVTHAWAPGQKTWREVHPRTLKSAAPRPSSPESLTYGRVGTVGKVNGSIVLRFHRNTQPDLPLEFVPRVSANLPESRYGPQNVQPEYCNSFEGGLILRPSFFGSGFWVIPQQEIDSYRRTLAANSKSTP